MKRTFRVAAVTGLLAIQLSGAALALAGGATENYKFDKELSPWTAGAESPQYISKGTLTRGIEYGGQGPTLTPNGYAALTNSEAQGIWMQAPAKNTGDMVDIEFDARSDQDCERCALLIYTGNKPPTSPWDFQKLDAPLT